MAKAQGIDFAACVNHLPAGILAQNYLGSITLLNSFAAKLLQIEPEKVLGRSLRRLDIYPESIALQEIENLCCRVREDKADSSVGLVLRSNDEKLKSYHFQGSILQDLNEEPQVLVLIQETPSGEYGNGRVEAHTTARLAATLAHEIRNPLSSIKGAAQYLMRNRADDAVLGEFLEIILDEVDAMNRVTTEFLEFSHRIQPSVSYVNRIDVVLQRTLHLLSPSFHEHGIRVTQNIDPNISEVLMESTQLEQILRNIILNAVEAMPDGGSLYITTKENVACRQPEVAISIRDTGKGVPRDQLKRIFDRSFTTKRSGAGLGLAIVREIIDNHGGRIQVESRPGSGTTFTLFLPATRSFSRNGQDGG